jgi:hypothetical protein
MNDAPEPERPGSEHKRLATFVGSWSTAGVVRGDSDDPPVTFQATDTYEWLDGGFFLVHRWDARMPDGSTKGIEIIGYDAANKTYPMHSFDNQGNRSVMQGRVDGDTWRFTGESVRFTGGFRDGGKTFAGVWEQRSSKDAPWQPWMDVELTKTA